MPHATHQSLRERLRAWSRRQEQKLEREGKVGPRYRRWRLAVGGVVLGAIALCSVVVPYSPGLGLLVIAVALGFGIAVYLRTGTAWGWASHRLYERDREPSAFWRNVVALAVLFVGMLLLLGLILVGAVLRAA